MCKHENIEVVMTFPETKEVIYKCQDCGALLDEDGVIIYTKNIIPF